MKNIIKGLLINTVLFSLFSCSQPSGATGKWENVVKDPNGLSVTTTLNISEVADSFTGNMTANVENNKNEILNSGLTNIDFSGYSSGKILVITDVSKSSDPYFTKSTLTVSEDGSRITLSPSGLVFIKK